MEEHRDMPVNNTIVVRKGSSAEWTSTNPILSIGELGFDTTNKIFKVGDGSSSWLALQNAGNFSSLVFNTFTESVVNIGNSGSSQTIVLTNGTVQTCTLTNNCVFTMPSVVAGKSFSLFLNTGSGNYTASFSGVLWSDSAPPTITTTANKVDILSFISDGTYWYGSYSQNYG